MTRNYLKAADAGPLHPSLFMGGASNAGSPAPAVVPKPATPPVAKLPLKSPAPVKPPVSNPQMFAPSTAKAAAQKYPVYHHCKECKATYGGARAIGAAKVYDVEPSDCRTCTPTAKSDWGKYPVQLDESSIDADALAEAKKRKADFFESRKSAARFPEIEKEFNDFLTTHTANPYFGAKFPHSFFESPGISEVPADTAERDKQREPKKPNYLKLSATIPTMVPYHHAHGPFERWHAQRKLLREEAAAPVKTVDTGRWQDRPESTNVIDARTPEGKNQQLAESLAIRRDLRTPLNRSKALAGMSMESPNKPSTRLEQRPYETDEAYKVRRAELLNRPLGLDSKLKAIQYGPAPTPLDSKIQIQWPIDRAAAINALDEPPKAYDGRPYKEIGFEEGQKAKKYVQRMDPPTLPPRQSVSINSPVITADLGAIPTTSASAAKAVKPAVAATPAPTKVPSVTAGTTTGLQKSGSINYLKLSADIPTMVDFFAEGGPADRFSKQKAVIDNEARRQVQLSKTGTGVMNMAGRPESTNVIDLRMGLNQDLRKQHSLDSLEAKRVRDQRQAVADTIAKFNPADAPRQPGESESAYLKRFYAAPNTALRKATANIQPPEPLNKNIQWPPASVEVNYPKPPRMPKTEDGMTAITGGPKIYVRNRSTPELPPGVVKTIPAGPSMPMNSPALANQLGTIPTASAGSSMPITSSAPTKEVSSTPPASKPVIGATPAQSAAAPTKAPSLPTGTTGLQKAGSINYLSPHGLKRAAAEPEKKEEKDEPKKKLGPIQHSYVADSVGGTAIERSADKMKTMKKPDSSLYDRAAIGLAPVQKALGSRIRTGGARLANNMPLRILSQLDPTRSGHQEGIVGALSGIRSGNSPELEKSTAQMYADHIKPHQAKLEGAEGPVTKRETPWHVSMQGHFADKDSDVAGHTYMRKERPFHYWLNPMSSAGPLSEIGDRLHRRTIAGVASPNSTLGRVGVGIVPGLAPFLGGREAQNKIRRSATNNNIYAPEAKPEVAAAPKPYKPYYEEEAAPALKAATILKKANPNWLTNGLSTAKNWAADVGTKAVQAFNPDQFSRAQQVGGIEWAKSNDPIKAFAAGHRELTPTTKGVAGGGLGLLAGAMAPSGMRSVAMPAAAGLGTMLSMSNGPNGFEWKNMLKPETLIGGGLAAGAGYLGSKMMGGDEEEEEDLLGRRRPKPSGSPNWLMPALGIGAAGLGGYALYNHLNKAPQAPPPPSLQTKLNAGALAGYGAGKAIGAIPGAAKAWSNWGAPPVATTSGPAAAPPVAPQPQIQSSLFDPATAAGVNKAIATPPAKPPSPPGSPATFPAGGQLPPIQNPFNNGSAPLVAATVGGALPALNQGGAIQEAATGVNPAGVRVAPPSQQLPPNLSPLSKIIYEQPDQLLAGISAIDPTKATPQQQASMRGLVSKFVASEAMNDPSFPRLSDMYRNGYAGDAAALQKAKTYQQILNKARQIGYGSKDFGNLNSLGEIDTSVPPTPMNLDTFKIPGMEAIGAFGYKDINSLAQAAADGDPNVPNALHALGAQGKITLFKVLQDNQYRQFQSDKGSGSYSAVAADPRAAALHGALQHSSRISSTPLEPYDPSSLANPDAFKALTAGQRLQLVDDIRNPDNLGKALSSLSPELRQQAISNIASNFSRHAHMRDADANHNLISVPDYLDPTVQTAIAKVRGLNGYQPLNAGQWRDLSAKGGNLGDFLSPYKLRETGALRTPEDVQAWQQAGPEAYKGYSPTQILTSASPESDQNIVNDWTKVLTSNLRKNFSEQDAMMGWTPKMTNKELGPLVVGLTHLKEYRPDVFKAVVNNLNQNFGKIPAVRGSRSSGAGGYENVPAYRDQIQPDSPTIDYNWDDHLNRFLGQMQRGGLNPITGLSQSRNGRNEVGIDQLPE